MTIDDIKISLETLGVSVYSGYPSSNVVLPYAVVRPLIVDPDEEFLCGQAISWDFQFSVYCCGASVEASFNLALAVMQNLKGKRVGNSTLSTSTGYIGAPLEGQYETQVTVQVNQGALA